MTKEKILEKWCNKCLSPGEKTFLDIDSDIIDGSLVPVWRAMEEHAENELSKYIEVLSKEVDDKYTTSLLYKSKQKELKEG